MDPFHCCVHRAVFGKVTHCLFVYRPHDELMSYGQVASRSFEEFVICLRKPRRGSLEHTSSERPGVYIMALNPSPVRLCWFRIATASDLSRFALCIMETPFRFIHRGEMQDLASHFFTPDS